MVYIFPLAYPRGVGLARFAFISRHVAQTHAILFPVFALVLARVNHLLSSAKNFITEVARQSCLDKLLVLFLPS